MLTAKLSGFFDNFFFNFLQKYSFRTIEDSIGKISSYRRDIKPKKHGNFVSSFRVFDGIFCKAQLSKNS